MECNETSMNAMHADIQAMTRWRGQDHGHEGNENGRRDDGQERHEGLWTHMHNAMEADREIDALANPTQEDESPVCRLPGRRALVDRRLVGRGVVADPRCVVTAVYMGL